MGRVRWQWMQVRVVGMIVRPMRSLRQCSWVSCSFSWEQVLQ